MTDMIVLQPDLESVREARRFVALAVGVWGMDDFLPRQIVSELVTNAVRVSREGQYIVVRVYENAGKRVLEVWDQSAEMPQLKAPGLCDVHGRGLLLVSALSRSWEVRPIAGGGKVVAVELAASMVELEEKNQLDRPIGNALGGGASERGS